ncbi:MAG: hypothetical protein QS721_07425 [Candidatus Endonucleobacter sp. (ex Gigantidas childressi)]|nr:hypothetical protein [Candidatus Endonucleobacter sp. (ex Gigantidas childressi)]
MLSNIFNKTSAGLNLNAPDLSDLRETKRSFRNKAVAKLKEISQNAKSFLHASASGFKKRVTQTLNRKTSIVPRTDIKNKVNIYNKDFDNYIILDQCLLCHNEASAIIRTHAIDANRKHEIEQENKKQEMISTPQSEISKYMKEGVTKCYIKDTKMEMDRMEEMRKDTEKLCADTYEQVKRAGKENQLSSKEMNAAFNTTIEAFTAEADRVKAQIEIKKAEIIFLKRHMDTCKKDKKLHSDLTTKLKAKQKQKKENISILNHVKKNIKKHKSYLNKLGATKRSIKSRFPQ